MACPCLLSLEDDAERVRVAPMIATPPANVSVRRNRRARPHAIPPARNLDRARLRNAAAPLINRSHAHPGFARLHQRATHFVNRVEFDERALARCAAALLGTTKPPVICGQHKCLRTSRDQCSQFRTSAAYRVVLHPA